MSETELEFEKVQSEIDDENSPPVEFSITTYPADFTLEILAQKLVTNEIEIPRFQRGFVWTKAQASRLIESFMMGLPVPQVFLYSDEDQKLLVIDGQQRLKSVQFFFEGLWRPSADGRRGSFRLEDIIETSRWYGKTFAEFSEADKRKFRNSVLRAIVVKQLHPEDNTSVYHIFERLNTGGTPLKGQEIRNSVYHGRFNDVLMDDLNGYPTWRRIIGRVPPDPRLKDVELILRYMALFHRSDRYITPMRDFLSSFMKEHRNPSDRFLVEERQRFTDTCENVLQLLGEKPFHARGPMNTSIFDAVFVTFARHRSPFPSDIRYRYEQLLNDQTFDSCTHFGTTSEGVVRTRLAMAEKILFAREPSLKSP